MAFFSIFFSCYCVRMSGINTSSSYKILITQPDEKYIVNFSSYDLIKTARPLEYKV